MRKVLTTATLALLSAASSLFAAGSPATRPAAASADAAVTASSAIPALKTSTAAPFEREVTALEAADHKANLAAGGVLFYGSSSIRLWKNAKDDFPGLNVINHGFGGSTAPDALRYFDRLVVPVKPATIVFYEGDNDLKKGRTPEQFLGDVQSFVRQVETKLPATKIIILSVKPSPSRIDLMATQRKVNSMVEGWIKTSKDSKLTFVNTFSSMLDAKGQPRIELYGPDKLHMTRDGYKIWISRLTGLLLPTADQTAAAKSSTPAKSN